MAKRAPAKKKPARTQIQASRELRPVQKAEFHVVSGAGKKRIIRDFLGLTAADEAAIEALADQRLQVNLSQNLTRPS